MGLWGHDPMIILSGSLIFLTRATELFGQPESQVHMSDCLRRGVLLFLKTSRNDDNLLSELKSGFTHANGTNSVKKPLDPCA